MLRKSGIMRSPERSFQRKRTLRSIHRRDNGVLWLMAIPGIAALLLFNYLPMFGLTIAFKNYIPVKGIWESEWNGFENFEFFFSSVDAVRTLRNTIGYKMCIRDST